MQLFRDAAYKQQMLQVVQNSRQHRDYVHIPRRRRQRTDGWSNGATTMLQRGGFTGDSDNACPTGALLSPSSISNVHRINNSKHGIFGFVIVSRFDERVCRDTAMPQAYREYEAARYRISNW
jgi:hypothetical protein